MKIFDKLIIVLSVALFVWSCSDDDENPANVSNDNIRLSAETIQVAGEGGSSAVTVTSSDDWRLAGVCDWVHPSATSGKSGDVVTFTVDANDGSEVRTATFKFFTGSSVAVLTVESASSYVMTLASERDVRLSKDESSISVQLVTNIVEPIVSIGAGSEWISYERCVDFAGKTTLSFLALENKGYKDRNATVTISSPLVKEPVVVNVSQCQTDAIIPEKESIIYDLATRTISFRLSYNIDYETDITAGQDWITDPDVSEPVVGDDGLSTVTMSYRLAEAADTRKGIIRFSNSLKDVYRDVFIVQKDPEVEVVEIPNLHFRNQCENLGWIMTLGGSNCIVLQKGKDATSLTYYYPEDVTGIENFPNLTSISLRYATTPARLRSLDLSGLHKVTSLTMQNCMYCSYFNFGDNALTVQWSGSTYFYIEDATFIGSRIESLALNLSAYYASLDEVKSIDVSECPALKKLQVKRGEGLTKIYLKEGQTIENIEKYDYTEIVYK